MTARPVRCSAWLGVISLGNRLSATTAERLDCEVNVRASEAEELAVRERIGRRKTKAVAMSRRSALASLERRGAVADAAPCESDSSKPLETQADRVTGAAAAGIGGGKQPT